MAVMTSFQNRLDEMERRLKADTEARRKARVSKTGENNDDNNLSMNTIQNSQTANQSIPVNAASRSLDLPLNGGNSMKTVMSDFQVSNSSSYDFSRHVFASSPMLDSRNSTPSPGEGSAGSIRSSSTSSSPNTPLIANPGGVLLGCSASATALPFSNTKRPRGLDLLCSSKPDSSKSDEIERWYAEIMKKAGVLTINGEKIKSDISELEAIGDLGQGTCGHVVKMRHRKTNAIMAVKQMRRSGNSEDNKRIIMDLDVVMKSHSCPYIVHCIGTFITPTDVYICMELMASCLDKLTKSLQEPIPENILGKITVATVNALNYLKEHHGVIHRDVKPSNILLDEKGAIKLCDFGISGHLVDSKAKTRNAGCAAYMSPERIAPPDPLKPDYDVRADIWSLGLSLVELATGEFPYKNCKTDFEMLTKVIEDDQPALPPGKNFSMDFRDFVSQCLTKDYNERPKYKKLLEHNFVQRYSKLSVDVGAWYSNVMENVKQKNSSKNEPSSNISMTNNENVEFI